MNRSSYVTTPEPDRPGLVGLHHLGCGLDPRCCRTDTQADEGLNRTGFKVVFYDTLEDFYLAEALE